MTTQKTREEICEREGILCDTGYSLHHCFFRSEYKENDFDEAWNTEPILFDLHERIHHGGNRRLEVYYKKRALSRYKGKFRTKLEKILKQKSYGIK
jgi:hypothetical protein